jgi:DNA-binding PadR family transcriptional regulator
LTIENLWLYIIKILKDEGELRAYDIKKYLITYFNLRPATITVYSVIYRMVREGLIVDVKMVDGTRYRVTEKGLETFKQGLNYINELLKILSDSRSK